MNMNWLNIKYIGRAGLIIILLFFTCPSSATCKTDTVINTYKRDSLYFAVKADSIIAFHIQSPNQKIPDRKTKCVIKTHINIKQNVIFGAKLKPV